MEVGKLYKSHDWNYEHPLFVDEDDYERYSLLGLPASNFLNPNHLVMVLGEAYFLALCFAKVLYKGKIFYILKRHLIPADERQVLAGRNGRKMSSR